MAFLAHFLRLCFIIYLGGIVPLIYLTNYSPHQELPRYRWAIFDSNPPVLPPDIIAALAGQPRPIPHTTLRYESTLPLTPHGLSHQLTQGYLLVAASSHWPALTPLFYVTPINLLAQSAYLPPPDKPPPFINKIKFPNI